DVPYFLRRGAAEVFGIGEAVNPIEPNVFSGIETLLLVPPFGCATTAVYQKYRGLHPEVPKRTREPLAFLNEDDARRFLRSSVENDLEEAAVLEQPRLGEILRAVRGVPDLVCGLTGSGSVIFALPRNERRVAARAFGALDEIAQHAGCALLRQK